MMPGSRGSAQGGEVAASGVGSAEEGSGYEMRNGDPVCTAGCSAGASLTVK